MNRLAELIPDWPSLRELRFSDEQADRYHRTGHWDHRGFDHLLADHAHRTPGRLACTDGRVGLTYAELYDGARAVAGRLLERGLQRADVVLVAMANDVDHVLIAYALAAAGLVAYELPTGITSEAMLLAAQRTCAGALITDRPVADAVRSALDVPGLIVGAGAEDPSLAGLAAGEPGPLAPQHPDDVAALIETASTASTADTPGIPGIPGIPRIVMRSANCSLAMARAIITHSGLSRRDVLLAAAPLQDGLGFITGVGSMALTGCTLVIAPDLDPAALLKLIAAHEVTRVATLPTIASRLLHVPAFESTDIASVEVIQTGGAVLAPDVARALEGAFGCTVTVVYGSIDVGAPTMVSVDDPEARRHSTLGRVVDGTELAIVDSSGQHLGPGEVGEVVMRGPDLALGYFGDEAATATVFDAAGWGHMGDMGSIDEAGYLWLAGRTCPPELSSEWD
jgi:non-ribosomal peptide synthetase component E (peptide arylation enzyme)